MGKEFVLLAVDDNPNNLFTIRALLGHLSQIQLLEALSGEQALNICLEQEVHLILLDVQMPGMDGFETARHLQMIERTRDIPIVFVTAVFKSEVFIQRGYALGAVDYMTKPIDDNLLINRVRTYQHLHDREVRLTERSQELQNALNILHATQKQLIAAEKMAALGSLVAGVAHEINTPVGIALTSASTLMDDTLKLRQTMLDVGVRKSDVLAYMDAALEASELILKNAERAALLIQSFKQVAVDQASEARRKYQLKGYLEEVLVSLGPNLKPSQVSITVECPEALELDGYPGALAQVITNLTMNALIHAFGPASTGHIQIAVAVQDAWVTLSFADDGSGIARDNLPKLFEPFFTTKRGQGGTGLGLHIVHNIVTSRLGGSISVASTPGQGTQFVMRFPRVSPHAVPKNVQPAN